MGRELKVFQEARRCVACEAELPLGARPLLAGRGSSRVLIIGQAPGRAAHESGVPWDDASGARLRAWLGLSDEQFYDASLVALVPMGFCYPGKGKTGDLSPRTECAPLWHDRVLRALRSVELTVYVGKYAFEAYLSAEFASLTDAVQGYRELLPRRVALPHPSPRNNIWLKKHAWFEDEVVEAVRTRVSDVV